MSDDLDRVTEFGEVFTPQHLVEEMVSATLETDTIPKEMTFLEPSCGEGVFLVEILKRKLKGVSSEKDSVWCVSTLYGIDIQPDNVSKTKDNLFKVWDETVNYPDSKSAVKNILNSNIINGDFLSGNVYVDGKETTKGIEFVEYTFSEDTDDVLTKVVPFDTMDNKVSLSVFFGSDDEPETIIKPFKEL